MHGLINRSLQYFIEETYGTEMWRSVARQAGVAPGSFEAMMIYDDSQTIAILETAACLLNKPQSTLAEDLGTFLVYNRWSEPLRRLLRFGGDSFLEFLHSLDDLAGRTRMAVPQLDPPDLELSEVGPQSFQLMCKWGFPDACHLIMGILRALADDYGALAVLEVTQAGPTGGVISISLLDGCFAEGRRFDLSVRPD